MGGKAFAEAKEANVFQDALCDSPDDVATYERVVSAFKAVATTLREVGMELDLEAPFEE